MPIAWVTADAAYGQERRFRRMLEETAVGYVPAVPKSQQVPRFGRIDHLFTQAPDEAWEKRSCGDGAKGPRVYHWAAVQLPVIEDFDGEQPTHHRWALARRSISKPDEIAYYLGYAPAGTGVDQLVRVAGRRWAIEECFQAAKNECGWTSTRSAVTSAGCGTSPWPCSRTPFSRSPRRRRQQRGMQKRFHHGPAHRGRSPPAPGN